MIAGVNWSQGRQTFFYGPDRYDHLDRTDTMASHDLAHVLVASAGGLPWLPLGSDASVRLAEYNAVVCEHLLSNTYNCIVLKSIPEDRLLPATLIHARWFVEHHYAPFPMSAKSACRNFSEGIDVTALTRLSPYYYRQRQRELSAGANPRGYRIRFDTTESPRTDTLGRVFQRMFQMLLEEMRRAHAAMSTANVENGLSLSERLELTRLRTEHSRLQEELATAELES